VGESKSHLRAYMAKRIQFRRFESTDRSFIICHAGSSSFGFVAGLKLIFRCQSGLNVDYHTQMNSTIFKEWFIQLLKNLEEPSIVVMDNASYHSTLSEDYPKTNTKKPMLKKQTSNNDLKIGGQFFSS